jgi:hypothetical protein
MEHEEEKRGIVYHNKPVQDVDGFWKWYFKQGWERPLSASVQLLVFLVFVSIVAYAASRHPPMREFWGFFVRDPFFYFMWLTLFLSYIDLSYMKYRLQQSGYKAEALGGRIEEQHEIPKQYRKIFGEDGFARLWSGRWLFLVFAFISGVRCLLR